MLNGLGALIKSGNITPLDGWGIENDLFALARSSQIKIGDYLDFAERYCMEAGYPINSSLSGHLNALSLLLSENTRLCGEIRNLSLRYHRSILEKLGWKESPKELNVTALMRSRAIRGLGANGDREVIAKAMELFSRYLDGGQIGNNIKSAVFYVNAYNGNADTYKKFLQLFKNGKIPEEQRMFLEAMSSFNNPDIIKKALDFSLSNEIRLQDAFIVPSFVSATVSGRKLIWGWTRTNWHRIMNMYSMNTNKLQFYLGNLGAVDDKRSMLGVRKFFSNSRNMRGDARIAVKRALELMEANIRFREFNE
jgi:puromycin-sensitive aminopeptidase